MCADRASPLVIVPVRGDSTESKLSKWYMSEIDDVSESDENHVVFAEEPVRLRSGQRRTSRKFSTKTEALLRRKREQWSATRRIFALWHSYLLLIAACAIACSVLVVILFWHVDWYERYRESGDIVEFQLHFLATFIKSWLLVNLSSEMLRFCYLLAVDSWRAWDTDCSMIFRRISRSCLDQFRHAIMQIVGSRAALNGN